MKTYLLLIVVAIVFAVVRFFIPTHPVSPHGSYEAFAHLFVGGLIGAALTTKKWFYIGLVVVLSIVELVAFFSLQ